MKYAIVFILGLLPLGLQAGLCGWKLAREEEGSRLPPEVPVPPAAAQADDLAAWHAALNELGGPEMFHPAVLPAVLPDAAAAEWKAAWQRCSRGWATAQAAVPVLGRRADGDYPQLAAALQEMESFAAQYDLQAADSDGRLQSAWNQRVARFLLAAARAARDAERYQDCVDLCDKLRAAYGDAAEAAPAARLKKAALFCEAVSSARKDLAHIGQPPASMPPAESIALLNRRRDRLSQIIDQQSAELRANEMWIPAGICREFGRWEQELKGIPAAIQPLQELVEADKMAQRRRAAQDIFRESQLAFERGDFDQCQKLCARLAQDFLGAIPERTVQNQSAQAAFAAAEKRLRDELDKMGEPPPDVAPENGIPLLTQRKEQIQRFLDKYRKALESETWVTAAVRADFARWDRQGKDLPGKIETLEKEQSGTIKVALLLAELPHDLPDRVARAADIARKYPLPKVRLLLRREVPNWIGDGFRKLDDLLSESAELQEAESVSADKQLRGLRRGHFEEFKEGGKVTGYRIYPVGDRTGSQGVTPVEVLKGRPGPSLPRRLVQQYNDHRQQLQKSPANVAAWKKFAEFCKSSQQDFDDWKQKPWVDDKNDKDLWLSANAQIAVVLVESAKSARQLVDDAKFWDNLNAFCAEE